MQEKIICHGCGIEIQSVDEKLEGYAPKESLQRASILCRRCFRLQNYGEFKLEKFQNDKFLEIIKKSNTEDSLVVYVIDIFNFYGSIIEELPKIIKNPILIAVNKVDLLPKSLKLENILEWIKEKLEVYKINYVDIEIISVFKNINIDSFFEKIKKHSNNKSVYMVGKANVGKSTIINTILKNYTNLTSQMITSSVFPGTTLKTIKIPFEDNCFLYDTPGLLDQASILNFLDEKNIRAVIPRKEIKPVSYQPLFFQSFFLGSVIRLDYRGEIGSVLIFYLSDRVNITRQTVLASEVKINKAFDKLVEERKKIPFTKEKLKMDDLEKRTYVFKNRQRKSIVINGLGFIDIITNHAEITLYLPKGVEVIIDSSLIGGRKK